MSEPDLHAQSDRGLEAAAAIARSWRSLGVQGGFLARDLDTGRELGFDVEAAMPLASVVKVPIAVALLRGIDARQLDPAQPVSLDPASSATGPTGAAAFRHPARIAVGDLIGLMLTLSDNAAADRLLQIVPPEAVRRSLAEVGHPEILVRHPMQPMFEAAALAAGNDVTVALELALAGERSGVPALEALDPERANLACARALVDLLADLWSDRAIAPAVCAEVRRLMRMQVFTHRLASDLRSDDLHVAGKTGSFLHLRHEIGVVESAVGDRVAIAALTRSDRRAILAPDIDLAIGAAARTAFEALRR